ncbi:MAG TPA: hypothetical protein VF712_14110 [Thermoleophilaceae bacterium]|jgi:hypothetical protein
MADYVSDPNGEVTNPEEAAEIKKRAATDEPGLWRADLWPNVPAAVDWANRSPISPPGSIVFNIRDNGQVWTYTLL